MTVEETTVTTSQQSVSKKPLRGKRRKVEETTVTTSQQSVSKKPLRGKSRKVEETTVTTVTTSQQSVSKKPLRGKRKKVEETTVTTSQQSVRADYTPGDFVVVGLKQRKEPISVYIAEVTHVYRSRAWGQIYEEILKCLLVAREVQHVTGAYSTENIISKLENPQLVNERGIFKFKTEELNNIKVDLMKIHKHVCFK